MTWPCSRSRPAAARVARGTRSALTATLNRFARACRVGLPWQDAAAAVAHLLTEPFAAEIQDATSLVVVPFMAGHRIPFHLLPCAGEAVGARRTVSVLPSTALIRHLRASGSREPGRLAEAPRLVVGNPAGMAWIPPGGGTAQEYPPLPFAEIEARAVARPGDV